MIDLLNLRPLSKKDTTKFFIGFRQNLEIGPLLTVKNIAISKIIVCFLINCNNLLRIYLILIVDTARILNGSRIRKLTSLRQKRKELRKKKGLTANLDKNIANDYSILFYKNR